MNAVFPKPADEADLTVKKEQLKNKVEECLRAGECLADAREIHELNREVNDMIFRYKNSRE